MDKKYTRSKYSSYLNAWSYLGNKFNEKIENLKRMRLSYQNVDMKNYMEYIFLYSMFYPVLIGKEDYILPDLNNINENGEPLNTPSKWFDGFVKIPFNENEISEEYIKIENNYDKKHAILNTGLLDDKGVEVYMVFCENTEGKNKQPWYFQSFKKANEGFLKTILLPPKVNLLTDIKHVIFDEQKLKDWNNINKIGWDEEHIFHDRKSRIIKGLKNKSFIVMSVKDLILQGYCNVNEQRLTIINKGKDYVIETVDNTSSLELSAEVTGILNHKVCETDSSETELLYIIIKKEDIGKNSNILPIYNLKEVLFKAIGESCRISKTNYKHMTPFIYNNQRNMILTRGFLLPLKFEENIFLTAAVNYINDKKYYIQTVLELSAAKKNADIICITDENWLHEVTKNK